MLKSAWRALKIRSLLKLNDNEQVFGHRIYPRILKENEYRLGCYVIQVSQNSVQQSIIRHSLYPEHRELLALLGDVESKLINEIERTYLNIDEIIPFRELSKQLWNSYRRHLRRSLDGEITKETQHELYYYIFFKIFGLKTLGPYLIDQLVHEIYVEKDGQINYLDHELWGRCMIENSVTEDEINHLISLVLLENNALLSRTTPSFKGDLVSDDFHLRVSIDSAPLSVDGTQVDIRKIFPYHFHLFRLLDFDAISVGTLSSLLVAMRFGTSITIIGPPNTGKTTLQNSLLQFLPLHWRIVSIEDTIESPPYLFAPHVRFKISERDEQLDVGNKLLESVKLLHRSPDYVNLGEISNERHASAWFQVLAAGIPSIQTIHGRNMFQLIVRLKEIFGIPPTLINSSVPHLLVEVQSFWDNNKKVRRVTNVGEVKIHQDQYFKSEDAVFSSPLNNEVPVEVLPLVQWNAKESQWREARPLVDSDTGRFICKMDGISRTQLLKLVKIVEGIVSSFYQAWKQQFGWMSKEERANWKNVDFQKNPSISGGELAWIKECYRQINAVFLHQSRGDGLSITRRTT